MGRFPEYPLTPVTPGGSHMHRTKIQTGTAPLDSESPQGCSHQFVPGSPAITYIGDKVLTLKLNRERFETISQFFNSCSGLSDHRIIASWRFCRTCWRSQAGLVHFVCQK